MACSKLSGDQTRFLRIALVIVDELTTILRDVLEKEISPRNLYEEVLLTADLFETLERQRDLLHLIQNACDVGYKDFDITLLYVLISNLCSKNLSPRKEWDRKVMAFHREEDPGDDIIESVRLIINKLYSHYPSKRISESEFKEYLAVIYSVCDRTGKRLNKNYSPQKALACSIDEDREQELMEKVDELYRKYNEMPQQFAAIPESQRRIKKRSFSATAKVTIQEKDPSKKGLSEVLLKTTENILNNVVDSIDEVTTEEELQEVYKIVEEFLQNESNEKTRASLGPFFDKLSSKISNYANQMKDRKMIILTKYFKFVMKLRTEYGANLKAYHSSLLLKLTFESEDGFKRFKNDIEGGKIEEKILQLLLFPAYIACFDSKAEDMIISLNDKTIYGSGGKSYYEGHLPRTTEGNIPTTSKAKWDSVSVYPYSKRAPQKDALTSHLKAEVTRSVGLVYVDGQPEGTGFRVGEKYIMACLHVIKKIIQGPLNFIRCERVYIQFERMVHLQNTDQSKIFQFEPSIVYKHEGFDVAVLELKKGEIEFPPPLTLFGANCLSSEEVHLIGHPGGTQMKEESEVYLSVIEPNNDVDIFIKNLSEWSNENFMIDYYSSLRELPRKILFRTTFDQGSSGSPGILIRNQKPCVVIMVAGGVPSVYYDKGIHVEPGKRVEFGYALRDIFDEMQMDENDRKLSAEIFKEWIS